MRHFQLQALLMIQRGYTTWMHLVPWRISKMMAIPSLKGSCCQAAGMVGRFSCQVLPLLLDFEVWLWKHFSCPSISLHCDVWFEAQPQRHVEDAWRQLGCMGIAPGNLVCFCLGWDSEGFRYISLLNWYNSEIDWALELEHITDSTICRADGMPFYMVDFPLPGFFKRG